MIRLPKKIALKIFEVIDSTNNEAKRLISKGINSEQLILAKMQTSGRGRRGRKWISPRGNLFTSLLLKSSKSLNIVFSTFIASLAMAEAVESISRGKILPICKWPNDLIVHGKKICGILSELVYGNNSIDKYFIIGIGVNISFYPSNLKYEATSFSDLGISVSVDDLITCYIQRFFHWLSILNSKGFFLVRKAWIQRSYDIGSKIIVHTVDKRINGSFVGVDDFGYLIVQNIDRKIHKISSGNVLFQSR